MTCSWERPTADRPPRRAGRRVDGQDYGARRETVKPTTRTEVAHIANPVPALCIHTHSDYGVASMSTLVDNCVDKLLTNGEGVGRG
jgi:hypothetical protein